MMVLFDGLRFTTIVVDVAGTFVPMDYAASNDEICPMAPGSKARAFNSMTT